MSTRTDMGIRFYNGSQQDTAKVTGADGDVQSSVLAQLKALEEKAERDGGAGDQLLDEIRNLQNLIALLEKMKAGGTEIDPSQVKALEGQIQALFGKINATYPSVVESLEEDVQKMKAASSAFGTEDTTDRSAGFSNGSLAEVMGILRELQNSYTKLMKLYQEMAQKQIEMSKDVVQASADATCNSIKQEAEKERMDMIGSFTSAGVSLFGGVIATGIAANRFEKGLASVKEDKRILEDHQKSIKEYVGAEPIAGEDSAAMVQRRAQQRLDNGGLAENKINDLMQADHYEPILGRAEHVRAVNLMEPEELPRYKESVDRKHFETVEHITSEYQRNATFMTQVSSFKDIAAQISNGAVTSQKVALDEARADYQSAATLGHANVDSLSKGTDTNRSTAQEMAQQANRVMENDMAALSSTSRAS